MQTRNCPYLPGLRGRGVQVGGSVTVGRNDFCRVAADKNWTKTQLPQANGTSHTAARITLTSPVRLYKQLNFKKGIKCVLPLFRAYFKTKSL
ncbi:unnamed protein product [Tetraodon nigroviridis]|uniref:(spotted green pufferfish) hypothetical protein n=1 Tax=Tetraodon nigroviridis TaxID=99883 RepID=Q4SBC6_TETNG|nr:unnamed protein product [Tetraodon nigroviridis]